MNPTRVLWTAAVLLLALLFSACASKTERAACGQRDWYELGRRDGSQGATLDHQKTYKDECGGDFGSHFQTVYANGRNAGLVEFCQPDNAFQLGRMGIAYMYVCASTMEPEFLISYRRGQQARLLELQKKELDAKIENLSERLQASTDSGPETHEIHSELDQLRRLRAANEVELTKITQKSL